ncbi:MAG: phosphoribosylglycinamide formyltransferase [Steroidobacteraceae bacterium]
MSTPASAPLPIVVLISGRGSNMLAIATAARAGELNVEVKAVISDQPSAEGLERAAALGIPTRVLKPKDFVDRAAFDEALGDLVASFEPGLVVLAGYMRILSASFVRRFAGRMLNIHPSLLPKHRGLKTHERVLAAQEREHGVSVHFVTEELDGGPVVIQAVIDVEPHDTVGTLSARIHRQEHRIYPQAVQWIASGRLACREGVAWLDGKPLMQPVVVDTRIAGNASTDGYAETSH